MKFKISTDKTPAGDPSTKAEASYGTRSGSVKPTIL